MKNCGALGYTNQFTENKGIDLYQFPKEKQRNTKEMAA